MASNSYIYQQGSTPNTSLLNSQKVKVFTAHPGGADPTANQIGILQSWAPAQSRPTEPVRSIGMGDRVAEQSVGVTDLTGTLSIAVMYLVNIMQVLGYNAGASGIIRSLKHHRWPFDIKEQIIIPDFIGTNSFSVQRGTSKTAGLTGNIIQTYYEGCWMQDYNITFEIGASTIMQDCTVNITDVYDPAAGRGAYSDSLVDRDATTISKLLTLA